MDITMSVTFDHSLLDAFNCAFNAFIVGKKSATKKKTVEPEEDAEEEETKDEETTDEDSVSLEDIRTVIKEKVKKGLKPKVETLLTKFKAKTSSDLKEDQYSSFYEKLKAVK